jgi:hypothetical protein
LTREVRALQEAPLTEAETQRLERKQKAAREAAFQERAQAAFWARLERQRKEERQAQEARATQQAEKKKAQQPPSLAERAAQYIGRGGYMNF